MPPTSGEPASDSVSLTAPTAASGTGFSVELPLAFEGSAFRTQARSALSGSIVPSGPVGSLPEAMAFRTLVWLTPRWAA